MPTPRDPADMTPDQRRQEVAAILAKGLLRYLRASRSLPSEPSSESSPHLKTCLAFPAETRPCVDDRPAG